MAKFVIGLISGLMLLALGLWLGYTTYPRWHPPPEIRSDTIYKVDTIPREIPNYPPHYIVIRDSIKVKDQHWMDSVLIAYKVDTAAILADYYAEHFYQRNWEDTLLAVHMTDVIAENRPIRSSFSYQILRPQQVINNSVVNTTYTKYLYVGLGTTFGMAQYVSLKLTLACPNYYFGLGYSPQEKFTKGYFDVNVGLSLWKK